ncbi:PIN domain-containing protein [bacterium AH-315-I18]|nr:PIN domain-containing protein [Phycisphaeraceae bacterium]MBN4061107.1 PIN domain-containing protein [bacterium AH-315-I18]
MARETYLLDANVIVRFLAADHSKHLEKAKQLISRAEMGEIELIVMPWILAEVVYVLSSVYSVPRKVVAEALEVFVGGVGITVEDHDVIIDALHRFAKTKVDFADALLAAYSAARNLQPASFDRDLDRFGDIKRLVP